ncbi:hypothetical protein I4U23_000915 [Adineta vaga]|nr:hypothetical protein I4U23_000915 [Adineta vaga]
MSCPTTTSDNHQYTKQFADYLEYGIHFPELSQIRQLDVSLQDCHRRIREITENLRKSNDYPGEQSQLQTMLINTLIQAKSIGDKKMELSQQMLDATERQSKKLNIAYQNSVESMNQQNSLPETNVIDSDNEYDSESDRHRSLWKRKTTIAPSVNLKRRCVVNSEQTDKLSNTERDKRKVVQRTVNATIPTGRRLRLNNESSNTQSDETTYCLCSQLSYGSMILCDSKTCEIKWFHFNCVHLTTKPKGKWFCPNCRENRI